MRNLQKALSWGDDDGHGVGVDGGITHIHWYTALKLACWLLDTAAVVVNSSTVADWWVLSVLVLPHPCSSTV